MSDLGKDEKTGKSAAKLAEVLGLLVQASESGNFNVVLKTENLAGEDIETVRLINKVVSNYSINVQEFADYAHELIEHQAALEKTRNDLSELNKSYDIVKSILKNSEAMICVNDFDTAKIILMTDSYKRHFGITGDTAGKTCYDVLYPGQKERCEWCPCRMLGNEPYEPIIWSEKNSATGGYYRNTDRYTVWPDGRRVHIQHRVDLTETQKIHRTLEKQHKAVSLLHEMGATLLEVDDTLHNLIMKSMGMVGRFISADRVQIWRNDMIDGEPYFTLSCQWNSDFAENLASAPAGRPIPDSNSTVFEKFMSSELINLALSDAAPDERDFMERYGIKAIAVIPLYLAGKFWGALSADNCQSEKVFSKSEISNITAAGLLIMSALIRDEMVTSIKTERDRNAALSHWYGSILDALPHSVTVTDMAMRYTFVNKQSTKLMGMSREEMLGKPCSIANAPICGTEECSVLLANRGVKQTYFKRDGLSFQVDTERLENLEGEAIAHVEVIQDITQIEEMAEKQALAESASEAKTKFLANMSHEIRTPINSIIGFTELAQESAVSPKTLEYLNMISMNSELLMQIINDILDISKVESGDMALEIIPFDLQALYESCLSVMTPKAKEKDIRLSLTAEVPEGKKVFGDPTKLAQILINILSNAMKFTEEGGVELSVFHEKISEQSVTMRFTVKDTGIGMTQEQLQIVFEPFMQADLSTTRKYGGTGLGLAITKQFVELMGGSIEIESEPGVGTTVSFTLTFETTDHPDDVMDNDYVRKLEKPIFKGDALVCEDNEMNQRVIREHLQHVGFKVTVAENGKEGIEKVTERINRGEKPFDIIFMDIHMPVMDGIEAVSRITELGITAPIVALTANIISGDRERYKAIGMKDYISKPFTSQELYRCLTRRLKPVGFGNANAREEEADVKLKDQLKKDFVKGNQKTVDKIEEAISAGDIVSAHRIAHTLKSTAALINRPELCAAAASVEADLRNGENHATQTQLYALRSALFAALGELAPYTDKSGGAEQSQSDDETEFDYDADKARALIKKLKPLLNSGNLESLKYMDALRAIPGSNEVLRQIADLYFDEAEKALLELEKKIGTS